MSEWSDIELERPGMVASLFLLAFPRENGLEGKGYEGFKAA